MTRDVPRLLGALATAGSALVSFAFTGCGYDKTGNEEQILAAYTAKFPEARWGVRCVEEVGADAKPSCDVGFEVRTLPNPTVEEYYRLNLHYNLEGRSLYAKNWRSTVPAHLDDHGQFRALAARCRGASVPRKIDISRRLGCHLVDSTLVFSTVGK